MMLIDTAVKPSPIHGVGLFAVDHLYEGQLIWVLHKGFDGVFSKAEWDLLPSPAKDYMHTYMYWSRTLERYVACLDNARHMNHSLKPNTKTVYAKNVDEAMANYKDDAHMTKNQWQLIDIREGFVVASKDIRPGEELLCNYFVEFPDFGGANTLDFLEENSHR